MQSLRLTIVPIAAVPIPVTPIRMSVIAISARSPIVAWCVVARSIKDRNRNGEKDSPPGLRLLLAEQRYGKHNGHHNKKLFHIIIVVDVCPVCRLRPANVTRDSRDANRLGTCIFDGHGQRVIRTGLRPRWKLNHRPEFSDNLAKALGYLAKGTMLDCRNQLFEHIATSFDDISWSRHRSLSEAWRC